MFNFLGLRRDSKKSLPEREADGGFVIVGETTGEKTWKLQGTSHASHPSTNVVVLPSQYPALTPPMVEPKRPAPAVPTMAAGPPAAPATDVNPTVPDFLGDVPFTLAPHILAMQASFTLNFDLSRDVNYNLTSFNYDFTLENSVLCDL